MTAPEPKAVQDYYPDDFAHCYGCGRLNAHGLHVRSVWDGDETVARFTPRAEHMAMPGLVYGGLLASLIDCHAMGTAAATAERADGREIGEAAAPRFVTASLRVDYLKPTPLGPALELRARVTLATERKSVVAVTVSASGVITVRGEVVAVRIPASMVRPGSQISDPSADRVCDEYVIVKSLLPLAGAHVLELGCGRAEKTRAIAQGGQVASITALEVDEIQHAKNLQIGDLPNVSFCLGGAEAIPAADASYDIVLMFKSLHHVPVDKVDQALAEIRRVLKPGGLAYLSEPVYAGEFNEILRLFHDEKAVREAAFAAIQRAVHGGTLELVSQTFFNTPGHFDDFEQFEEQVLKVTHTHHQLSPEVYEAVRAAFMRHMTPHGVDFQHPVRVDLLRRGTKEVGTSAGRGSYAGRVTAQVLLPADAQSSPCGHESVSQGPGRRII